jgi:adenylate cyclase
VVRFSQDTFSGTKIFTFIQDLDNSVLDMKFIIRGAVNPQEFQKKAHVVIVSLDEKSMRMNDLGLWPWPRTKIAKLVTNLIACGAKIIGFDAVFSEPDSSRIVPVLDKLIQLYDQTADKDPVFTQRLSQALDEAQGDKKLAAVLEESKNVVLGYFFFIHQSELEGQGKDMIAPENDNGLFPINRYVPDPQLDPRLCLMEAIGVRVNLPVFNEANEYFGYFNLLADSDGIFRKVPMVFLYKGNVYPSLSLELLSLYYNQPISLFANTTSSIRRTAEEHLELYLGPIGNITEEHLRIPLQPGGLFRLNFYGGQKTFQHVSAGDIIHDEPEACRAVKDKVALVGATTIGIYDLRPMPFDPSFSGVELHATAVENVLSNDLLIRPDHANVWEALFLLVFGVVISWLLTRFRLTTGLMFALALVAALAVVDFLLFYRGLIFYPVLPSLQVGVLFVFVAAYRYATEEREKSKYRHAFQFYLSKSIIDIIVQDTSKLKLGGERRELSVLFSDIRGFTTISEQLAPEVLTELLNEYLTPMSDLVLKYNGLLDKYIGDMIMAFYGAPVQDPNHASAACETALDMMDELARLQESWRARQLPVLDIGIGINTGPMSIGNMGSRTRFNYTVVGDHVNLGSRLEGLNRRYGTHILISEFTHAHVKDLYTCRQLDSVVVKGKVEPVRIFELLHRGSPDHVQDAWINEFDQGILHYRAKQWDQACACFDRVLQKRPDDPPTRIYINRCEEMKISPPGPDWNGVFIMETK